jgi:hypothetical protein
MSENSFKKLVYSPLFRTPEELTKKTLPICVVDVLGIHLNESSFAIQTQTPEKYPWQTNLGWKCYGICVAQKTDLTTVENYCSAFYVPGEFCRQSEIIEALSAHTEHYLSVGKQPHKIYIERGAFLSPSDFMLAYEKFSEGAKPFVTLVDAGSSFGSGDRILDFNAFTLYKKNHKVKISLNSYYLLRNFERKYKWQTQNLIKDFISEIENTAKYFCIEEVFYE